MHSFLKTIGYSGLTKHQDEEKLIRRIIREAKVCNIISEGSMNFAELQFEVADGVGIIVRGEYDDFDAFHPEHYFPYVRGNCVSLHEEVFVSKRVDTDAYTGMSEDFRVGVSIIFYLQNAVDYVKEQKSPLGNGNIKHPVTLSGLSCEGKILLPVYKDKKAEKIMNSDMNNRAELIAEAKRGNREAMESLAFDDFENYAQISKRIRTEDIYSIVDTTFIPYGSESDNYTVLATILEVNLTKNKYTGEEMYVMDLVCNSLDFTVCINKKDLLGEPAPGRRFRGIVWLQGYVEF